MSRYFYVGILAVGIIGVATLLSYGTQPAAIREIPPVAEFGGVSLRIEYATPTYPNVFYPSAPARYVLETAAGFTKTHTIKLGTQLLLRNLPSVSQ